MYVTRRVFFLSEREFKLAATTTNLKKFLVFFEVFFSNFVKKIDSKLNKYFSIQAKK